MKRLALALLLCTSHAAATGGTHLGESPRVAALAGAASARPGDSGSIVVNPAGLADLKEPEVLVNASLARLDAYFARHGEPRSDRSRWISGFGIAAGTPLPWILERFRLGFALYTPSEHVLEVRAPERADEPTSPSYDGRPEHISATAALAFEILPELRIGAGVLFKPHLDTPTDVSFDASRGDDPEDDVVVRLERDLKIGFAPVAGIRAQPLPELGLAVVYRGAVDVAARGKNRTVAGGILADDPIDYGQFWEPDELVWGAVVAPSERWSVSADATWSRWGKFQNASNDRVHPPFRNVLSVRAGLEVAVTPWLLRAGYAFEPTPIPDQTAADNFLGADTHVIGLGAGLDLRKLWRAPLRVDLHMRSHLAGTQSVTKQTSALPDADAETPGQQIDNLGYPGFESRQLLFQGGLSMTVFVR